MKNLFKYAASYWKAMIAIVLILVVQAYCDLSLPAYTSDIVNVGIQQGGIEDEVPRQIATEEMEKLLLFVSEDDQQTVMDAYTEDNTSYKKEAYVLKDSVAEEGNTMENLKDILQIPMIHTKNIVILIIIRFCQLHCSLTFATDSMPSKLLPRRRIHRISYSIPDFLCTGRGRCNIKLIRKTSF